MKKEILKTIAGVMAATLFISGCGVKGKLDVIDEADESTTTEVATEATTEASAEASDDTANKDEEPADLLTRVKEAFEDADDMSFDDTDFVVDYDGNVFDSTSKWDDYTKALGYPEKYEDNNFGFISNEEGYRWELRYPASSEMPYEFRVILVSPSMEREGADTYIDFIALDQAPTKRGIKAGDSLEALKGAYGKPGSIEPYEAANKLVSVIYSCDTGNLEFVLDDDTVKYIIMDFAKDYADEEVSLPEPGTELSFRGWYSKQGSYPPEFFSFEDSDCDLNFENSIGVDLTDKQKDFVLANPYEKFEITFEFTEESMYNDYIYHVKAKDIEIVPEDPSAAATYDASTDPLVGLVAEDILTRFRATNPVKNKDSVSEESLALGRWARKTIGKDGFSEEVREKGKGVSYEFWFGTDVGNNFDNNVPYMYETYYTLKDYFTSDGKNNKDYYDEAVEENEYLGDGDPERIKQMYQDMQEIVTIFNNLIREQH